MKGKYLFGAVITTIVGALLGVLIYSSVVEKKDLVEEKIDHSVIENDQNKAHAFMTSLQSTDSQVDFTYAAEETVHAVVHVRTKSMVENRSFNPLYEWFYGDQYRKPREVSGFGSGVIISSNGYIITNNHVIEDADNIEVKLNDNRVFNAELVGRDPSTDIALLKIEAEGLDFLRYGDSDKLKIGEWVLAVGNPYNLTSTVTAGIVSAKGRNLGILDSNYTIESFIQTDAALNPGNSGGALVDTKGLLVGITSAIYSPNGAYAGNSFAIPVSIVKKVVEDLEKYGEVQRAVLGIEIREVTDEDVKNFNIPVKGVFIANVLDGSAKDANLKEKDIIVRIEDKNVKSVAELQEEISKHRPGDKIKISFYRNGKLDSSIATLKNVAGNTDIVEVGSGLGSVLGARMEPLTQEERKMLNVKSGVKIVNMGEGRLADMGIKTGTVITSVNGMKINSVDDFRDATNNGKSLKSIEGIQSNGTFFSYRFGN